MSETSLLELEKMWRMFHKCSNSNWSGMSTIQIKELAEKLSSFQFELTCMNDFVEGLVLMLKSTHEFSDVERSDMVSKLDGLIHSYLNLCRSMKAKD